VDGQASTGAGGPRATADPRWSEIDRYIADRLIGHDPPGEALLAASAAAGLGHGAVSSAEGRLLELLARARGARRILEIGTHGGYSTLCLARALAAGGRLTTLELNARHAEVARANLQTAGFGDVVDVRVGRAIDTLEALRAEGAGPFDLIFIDADKQSNCEYFELSLELSAPGTVMLADNVVRAGVILDPEGQDPRLGEGGVQALRRFFELVAASPRVRATAIQTVGSKGHDGFLLAVVI